MVLAAVFAGHCTTLPTTSCIITSRQLGLEKNLFFVSGLLFAYSKFSAQQYLPLQGPYKYQSIR
jgi:hypothetical protein